MRNNQGRGKLKAEALVETVIIPDITKTQSSVVLYIVLKKKNTALHGSQFDIVLGNQECACTLQINH